MRLLFDSPEYCIYIHYSDGYDYCFRFYKDPSLGEARLRQIINSIKRKFSYTSTKRFFMTYRLAKIMDYSKKYTYPDYFKSTTDSSPVKNMAYVSFEEKNDGRPICLISQGEHKGQVCFLYQNNDSAAASASASSSGSDSTEIRRRTAFSLPKGSKFEVIPNTDEHKRDVYYIAGASGSGKSYFVKGLIEKYRKLYPAREVYLCSQLEEDETLDSMRPKIKRISPASFLESPPVLDEFKDCMMCFDDFDSLPKAELQAVWNCINLIAIQGRHTHTSLAVISHYLSNYKSTKLILNECTQLVVYPQATSNHELRYLLKKKMGLEEEEIRGLKKKGSRWICFSCMYPQYMITENQVEVLHQS